MNGIKWTLLILALLVIGVAVWLATQSPIESAPTGEEAVLPAPDAEIPAVKASNERPWPIAQDRQAPSPGRAAEPGSRLAIMRDAENAPSAVERAQALERLSAIEPALAARKLLELARFCGPKQLDAQEYLGHSPQLLERRRAWCSGLVLTEESMQERLDEVTHVDPELEGDEALIERLARKPYLGRQNELDERLASEREAGRTERFTQLLRQAHHFDDLIYLLGVNVRHAEANGGDPLWHLGLELKQRYYPQAELVSAQSTAIWIYGCRRFGGCGRGQYTTMIGCTVGWFGECAPGSSLEEQIYLTTAPATYNLALEILLKLRG